MGSNPVYGLIFLFRWREDNDGKQEATCPDGLWFANQVGPPILLLNVFLTNDICIDRQQCLC